MLTAVHVKVGRQFETEEEKGKFLQFENEEEKGKFLLLLRQR